LTVFKFGIFDFLLVLVFLLISLSFIVPILMQVALSFSDADELGFRTIGVFPVGLSLDSYQMLFADRRIVRYYFNTILYAVVGTVIMLSSTSLMAFPLTFRDLRGKNLVVILLSITMFFTGGLVPFYLTVLALGLVDTIWALVLPGAITAWYVIIFRTFMQSIPDSLKESAYMDGAGHFSVLYHIVLPLSKPLLATFTLFHVVGHWNDFFTALVFLRHQDKQPVQLFLRRILILLDYRDIEQDPGLISLDAVNSRTVKAAAVMITITPILCIYPFLQKYFTKGILIGALKN
jgi:putative aldouronate transport system permease protein